MDEFPPVLLGSFFGDFIWCLGLDYGGLSPGTLLDADQHNHPPFFGTGRAVYDCPYLALPLPTSESDKG